MIDLLRRALGVAFPLALRARRVYRKVARPITVGVRALVLYENQVLLVQQHGDSEWILPGGAAGRGETLREAAVREACEETGYRVAAERLLGMFSTEHEGMTNHVAVFVCHLLEATPLPARLNIEIAAARWWALDALPYNLHPTVHMWLEACAAGAQGLDARI